MHRHDDGVDPDSTVAKLLGVHVKSLPRWDKKPELNFPKPIYINGRKYRRRSEIKEFLRRAAVAHASRSGPP
jgi:predicted DNA-binding transcriptional regulator AlpA